MKLKIKMKSVFFPVLLFMFYAHNNDHSCLLFYISHLISKYIRYNILYQYNWMDADMFDGGR